MKELRAQLANDCADLETLWNKTKGTARDRSTKALILLSRRAIALLESEIKEKEQDIRCLEALIAGD